MNMNPFVRPYTKSVKPVYNVSNEEIDDYKP